VPITAGDYNGDGYDDLLAQVVQGNPSAPTCCEYDVIPGSASGLQFGHGVAITPPDPLLAYGTATSGDVNNDGYADIAIQAAANDALQVMYGSATGLGGGLATQSWNRETPGVPGDDVEFGRFSTQFADFNGDGYDDLAFGERNGAANTDHVTVLYGTSAGLTTAGVQDWAKTTPGVPGHRHTGDDVGVSLGAGDFNGAGPDELAISATPDLLVLPGTTAHGLVAKGSLLWKGTTGSFTSGTYGKGAPDDLLVATGAATCTVDYGRASAATGLVPSKAVSLRVGSGKTCGTLPTG